jgi:hypothetical protein
MCSIPSKRQRVYVFEDDSLSPKIIYIKINKQKILNDIKKKLSIYFNYNETLIK